jgi:hypothetical protein
LGPEKAAGAKKIRFRFHEKPPGKGRFPQKLKNARGGIAVLFNTIKTPLFGGKINPR